ncbi:oxidoreductase NAD-binding domain-containing protein 1 isoform X1 [Megalops cyprinoides]|uniref:oxidoreductase NAD-binding domain-containing protein 1 isoform X1 n=1 Tax=Megalops cyprinoides TaxID=118141 RepID=UPI0018650E53|nr:oxidoreductase NAD-binding domain-containing protein 1 isoform X1 [Megalops cyprinoides]XP_036371459.1 oxidoreductase NAD-binding domain-containing protein 1 isoform X1 [Megalops cyprinoides]XP_036371460.1 oxidoreductase NAD-binding domain-containing protein 1 isoform X1 [Megalops cyprinoides]
MPARSLLRAAGSCTAPGPSRLLQSRAFCPDPVTRKMTSRRKTDHLERTAANFRQMAAFPATVCGIMNESEQVRRLRLAVTHPDFSFKAGQWVDFFIPGMEKVGGFSICSTPTLLRREGVIELAVKYSQHPPAHWVHRQCTLDSQVAVRVGGDFFFDPAPLSRPVDLLLVAGGVGINPLYSILMHAVDLQRERLAQGCGYEPGAVRLCYSAKSAQDLLFKKSIIQACQDFPGKFFCDFHVTRQSHDVDPEIRPFINGGRISEQVLKEHLQHTAEDRDTLCYLCGPPPMIESVSEQLQRLGVARDRILFEKWW